MDEAKQTGPEFPFHTEKYGLHDIVERNPTQYTDEAHAALAFVERWGMVAGVTDGEDSAGRAKLRLATTDEVVERAVETAEKLYAKLRDKGLVRSRKVAYDKASHDAELTRSEREEARKAAHRK